MTAEEIIANGLHLAHFNPNHDPRNGQFAKSGLSRAIERHKQNKVRTDDYRKYAELKKRDLRSLTNEELEFVTKRKELEKKARGKTPAREAAEAEMARFAVRTIGSAVVIAAAAIGANYLRKKYDITLEKVAEKAVSGAAKFTGTIAKETASAVTKAVKDSLPTIKDATKEVSKNAGKAALDAMAKVGDAELKAIDKAKAAADKFIDAGAKTKPIKVAADAIDAAEKAGKKVGSVGKVAGKAALDAMAKVGDAELKAIDKAKAAADKFIDAGAKTKPIKVAADALDAAEKASKKVRTVGKSAGKSGKKVGTVGKAAGKAALDAMAKVGDAELKAIEAGKTILKKFGL